MLTKKLQRNKFLLILVIIVSSIGCNKIDEIKNVKVLNSNTSNNLLKVIKTDNDILVFGGYNWQEGEVLSYKNNDFSPILTTDVTFLNARYNSNNNTTTAVGLNGLHYNLSDTIKNQTNGNFQVSRDIYFGTDNDIIVGGKSYLLGYIVRISKDKKILDKIDYPYEFRAIDKIGEILYACGFGIIARSDDFGLSWHKTKYDGDFFLSIITVDNQNAYIIGQENTLFQTKDGGESWIKSRIPGNSQVNHGRLIDGSIILFCDEGLIKVKGINDTSWKQIKVSNTNINDGVMTADGLLVVGDNGYTAKIEL